MKSDKYVEALAERLFDTTNTSEKTNVMTELGLSRNEKAAQPLMKMVKETSDSFERKQAVFALGMLGFVPDEQLVVNLLQDPDQDMRETAAYALRKGKSLADVTPLINLLNDESNRVIYEAIGALGSLGNRAAIEPLTTIIFDLEKRPFLRSAAIKALGKIGALETLDTIIGGAVVGQRHQRFAAVRALKYMGLPGLEKVRSLFGSADVKTRYVAVWLVGFLGNSEDIKRLQEIAQEDKGAVIWNVAYWFPSTTYAKDAASQGMKRISERLK
jgi:hypothetical protein